MASISPEIAHNRARVGALSRAVRNGERPEHELLDAKRDLRAAKAVDYLQRVLAEAPPLTQDQRERIAALLRSGGGA